MYANICIHLYICMCMPTCTMYVVDILNITMHVRIQKCTYACKVCKNRVHIICKYTMPMHNYNIYVSKCVCMYTLLAYIYMYLHVHVNMCNTCIPVCVHIHDSNKFIISQGETLSSSICMQGNPKVAQFFLEMFNLYFISPWTYTIVK